MLPTYRLGLSGLAWFCIAASVPAQTAAFSTTGGQTLTFAWQQTFGYKFDLTQEVIVTKLGWSDLGTWDSSDVGIFNRTTGILLRSATVSSTSADIVDGYKYVTLATPLTLTAGQYTIGGTGRTVQTNIANVTPHIAGLSYQGGVWKEGTTLNFPNSLSQSSVSYFGPNFQAVPEPSVMVALGVGAMAVLRRRRKA